MLTFPLSILTVLAYCFSQSNAQSSLQTSAQKVNLWKLQQPATSSQNTLVEDLASAPTFPQYNFTQPLDHFESTGFTFNQRYWVSDRYYKPGGPVIVLDSGESSGTGRLVYMQQGIVDILTNATNGLGIVLEHRYYGASVPVMNFTTDSLRYVNLDDASPVYTK